VVVAAEKVVGDKVACKKVARKKVEKLLKHVFAAGPLGPNPMA
jgi:hypothetical protein